MCSRRPAAASAFHYPAPLSHLLDCSWRRNPRKTLLRRSLPTATPGHSSLYGFSPNDGQPNAQPRCPSSEVMGAHMSRHAQKRAASLPLCLNMAGIESQHTCRHGDAPRMHCPPTHPHHTALARQLLARDTLESPNIKMASDSDDPFDEEAPVAL